MEPLLSVPGDRLKNDRPELNILFDYIFDVVLAQLCSDWVVGGSKDSLCGIQTSEP